MTEDELKKFAQVDGKTFTQKFRNLLDQKSTGDQIFVIAEKISSLEKQQNEKQEQIDRMEKTLNEIWITIQNFDAKISAKKRGFF